MRFRRGKSKSLRIFEPESKTWLKIRDKAAFYKRTSIGQMKAIVLSRKMILATINLPEKDKQKIIATIKKMNKAIKAKKNGKI